jgi:hypothetical protein
MKSLAIFLLLAIAFVLKSPGQEIAERASVCQVKANPEAYNHKLLEISGAVRLQFEGQHLDDESCPEYKNSIWITFGGDVSDPEMFCCGNHDRQPGTKTKIEGIDISIQKDENFSQLLADAKAYRKPTSKTAHAQSAGSYYDVSATLVGRFFAGNQHPIKNQWQMPGYGHMGCCTLFAIEKVISIDNLKSNAQPGDLKCFHEMWRAPEDKDSLKKQQANIRDSGETWRMRYPDRVAQSTLTQLQGVWKDTTPGRFVSPCKLERFHSENGTVRVASCDWKAEDDNDQYHIQLFKYGSVKGLMQSWDDIAWVSAWATRNHCIDPSIGGSK